MDIHNVPRLADIAHLPLPQKILENGLLLLAKSEVVPGLGLVQYRADKLGFPRREAIRFEQRFSNGNQIRWLLRLLFAFKFICPRGGNNPRQVVQIVTTASKDPSYCDDGRDDLALEIGG